MGLNSDIADVKAQLDKVISGAPDAWADIAAYDLKIKDRKNMKSVYGLIYNILHHGKEGQRIIDRTPRKNLDYLYSQCAVHVKTG
jgi:hypothetical protein